MRGKRSLLFLISLCFVVVFLGSLFVCVVLYINYFGLKTKTTFKDSHHYKYLRYDPAKKSSNSGFIRSSKSVGSEGFKYIYNEGTGSHNLISSFDKTEYKCSGSCYCEGESTRRSSGIISLTRSGIIFLVAAVSSSVAIKSAKEYYHEECISQYSASCNNELIVSEVDECVPFLQTTDDPNDYTDMSEEELKKRLDEIPFQPAFSDLPGEYFCRGGCEQGDLPTMFQKQLAEGKMDERTHFILQQNYNTITEESKKYNCDHLELKKYVTFDDIDSPTDAWDHIVKLKTAGQYFIIQHLNHYCMDNSRKAVELVDVSSRPEAMLSMCVGNTDPFNIEKRATCVKMTKYDVKRREEMGIDPEIS